MCLLLPCKYHQQASFSVGYVWWGNVLRTKTLIPRSDGRIRSHQQASSLIFKNYWKSIRCTLVLAGSIWDIKGRKLFTWKDRWEAGTFGCLPTILASTARHFINEYATAQTLMQGGVQDVLWWRQPVLSYGGSEGRRRLRKASCIRPHWNCVMVGGRMSSGRDRRDTLSRGLEVEKCMTVLGKVVRVAEEQVGGRYLLTHHGDTHCCLSWVHIWEKVLHMQGDNLC